MGVVTSENRKSRQSMAIIARALMRIVALAETIWVATFVTTDCMAPMSLKIRDWISPVRVEVKKGSPMRWRWANTRTRRSCMIACPTRVERKDWNTLKTAPAA